MLGLGWWTHHPFGIVGAGVSSLLSETIARDVRDRLRRAPPALPRLRGVGRCRGRWRGAARVLGLPEADLPARRHSRPDIFIVAMLAPLGAIAVAAFRALNVVSDLTFVVPGPLQSATQIVIGQRLGARDPAGARGFFERARSFSFVATTLTGVVTALAGVAAGIRLHARRERRDASPRCRWRCTWSRCRSKAGR